ncbi:MAG: hypothetical protein COV48_09770 [Elusimicrobia bacterium CG11_big_fil_rev_8_21_14_0_20_64_6]|nr:MAG: hypothetical protein COV48_09770 [Elusimicrobia bacterium CG11_big_fil_rev_8_21_14_0_20_64_6]
MTALLIFAAFALPAAWYFWRDHKLNTPSMQWPALKSILGLTYEANPPRLGGAWNGRKVAIETVEGGVTVTAWLNAETSLRVECGPKDVVTQRAGMLVPDALTPAVTAFRDKLLARCSDKNAGPLVFDATMQSRLADLPAVDFVGEQFRVVWRVPVVRDPNDTEALLGALCAIADGLESFPKSGAMPNAQTKRS